MPDPATLDEYTALYHERTTYSGSGPTTRMHVPCPFCAAPGFLSWTVWPGDPDNVETVMARGAVCTECGRGCRADIVRNGAGVAFEFVQTEGSDPPSWLPPMRRVTPPDAVAEN